MGDWHHIRRVHNYGGIEQIATTLSCLSNPSSSLAAMVEKKTDCCNGIAGTVLLQIGGEDLFNLFLSTQQDEGQW